VIKASKYLAGVLCIGMISAAVGGYLHFQSQNVKKPVGQVALRHPVNHIQLASLTEELKSVPDKVYYRNRVVIVTFHDIAPIAYSSYVVTPSQFSEDLDAISARFHILTNEEFTNFLNHDGTVPPNSVLLTFDDGYRGMYKYALPVLLTHHLQGTFFEIVGTADKQESNYLEWPQIEKMVHDGMVVESHTYNSHYEVRSLTGQMEPVFDTRMKINGKPETLVHYDVRVFKDFSRARLELTMRTGEAVNQFAWPFGWGTSESTTLAKWAGYRYIYTTTDGYVNDNTNPTEIPRIDIGKPWISPVMALKMIIHYSNVEAFPNKGTANHHGVTEVNIVSRQTGRMTDNSKGSSVKAEAGVVKSGSDKSTNHSSQLPAKSGTIGNRQDSCSGEKPSGTSGKPKNDSTQNSPGSTAGTDNGTEGFSTRNGTAGKNRTIVTGSL
jgi:peptidoglycan/xylan/chitin deacetylase (PgdA/CDA1 family)